MLDILQEVAASFAESLDYLRDEIDFCLVHFPPNPPPNQQALVERAHILKQEFSRIDPAGVLLDVSDNPTRFLAAVARMQAIRAQLPRPLFEISQSVSNHRSLPSPPGQPDNPARLMKAVHPYYHSSFLGIECFSEYYHHALNGLLLDSYQPSPPVVDIWASERYAWEPLLSYDVPPAGLNFPTYSHPDARDRYHTEFRRLLNMNTLKVPRWASPQLRLVGAFLPHEYLHRIMAVINKFVVQDGTHAALDGYPHLLDHVDQLYGPHIRTLFAALYNHISLLAKHVYSSIATVDHLRTEYESTLQAVVEEMIADIVAFYVVGPPYALALSSYLLPKLGQSYLTPDQIDALPMRQSRAGTHNAAIARFYLRTPHPPPVIRMFVVALLTERLGYRHSHAQLREFLAPIRCLFDPFASELVISRELGSIVDERRAFFRNRSFMAAFLDYIQQVAFDGLIENLYGILGDAGVANFTGTMGPGFRPEGEWQAGIDSFRGGLLSRTWKYEFLMRDHSPVDILTLIWMERFRVEHDPHSISIHSGYGSLWRLYLESYMEYGLN